MLEGLGDSWIRATEGPETFSPFDVVGHLIDGEETDWIPRARIILAQGENLRFEPYDRFRHKQRNAERSPASLLKGIRGSAEEEPEAAAFLEIDIQTVGAAR